MLNDYRYWTSLQMHREDEGAGSFGVEVLGGNISLTGRKALIPEAFFAIQLHA
jgi:hypothetical protein